MTHRSRCLQNMDPDNHLDAPAPPPSTREAGASSPAPLSAAGTAVPFPSLVVLRVLPLRGSPAPIGCIYDATPDADGGLLAAALAFFINTAGPSGLSRPLPRFGGLSSVPGCGFVGRARQSLTGSYSFLGIGAAGWSLRSFAHRLGDCIYDGVLHFFTFDNSSTSFRPSLGGVGPRFHLWGWLSYGEC